MPFAAVLLTALIVPSAALDSTTPDAFDILVEAARRQGFNHAMIKTGYAEIEETTESRLPDEAELKDKVDRGTAGLKRAIAKEKDPARKKSLEGLLESYPKDQRKAIEDAAQRTVRTYKVTFDGNDFSGRKRQEVATFDPASGAFRAPRISVREEANKRGGNNIFLEPTAHLAVVTNSNTGALQFQAFGRLQGDLMLVFSMALLKGGDLESFAFSDNIVAQVKESLAQSKAKGTPSPYRLVGTRPFEDSIVYVVEMGPAGKPHMRIWVDAARGYICPLIEEIPQGKLKTRFESSGYFLHEQSGLYFPALHVVTLFDKNTEKVATRSQYKIDPKTFQFNLPISDKEFSVAIPFGTVVRDERGPEPVDYKTTLEGVNLRFTNGKLDLSKVPGVEPVVLRLAEKEPDRTGDTRLGRLLALVSVIVIVVVVLVCWRCNRGARVQKVLFLAIVLGTTASAASAESGNVKSDPATLDFGEVLQQNRWVEKELFLKNEGQENVRILKAVASCGCTVAEAPKAPIAPGGRVSLKVKFNPTGRKGKVTSEVAIEFDNGKELLVVPLTATIVDEYWLDRPAVRISFSAGEEVARGTFKVFTEKWPSLDFARESGDPDLTLQETSRQLVDRRTVISYDVLAKRPKEADERRTQVLLKPAAAGLPETVVPVYIFVADAATPLARPSSIPLGVVRRGGDKEFSVFLDKALLDSVQLKGSEALSKGLQFAISRKDPARARILVRLSVAEDAPIGLFRGWLLLKTEQRNARVEVLGAIADPEPSKP